jgi:hypothetical protein
VIDWIKRNKLASFLLLLIGGYLLIGFISTFLSNRSYSYSTAVPKAGGGMTSYSSSGDSMGISPSSGMASVANLSIGSPIRQEVAPSDNPNRLVIQETNFSLLVKNVSDSNQQITDYAKSIGGFMVSSSLSNPQEAATATLVIRVPQDKMKAVLDFIRGKAVKVVSENLMGTDVTDQYTDIEARLATLNQTKAKFEEIMAKATQVQDILQVQQQIISLQNQIDSLKGQQQYLEKTAQLTKITIYLATDELALPYAPSQTWRPEVIFKTAVRSLVETLRGLGELVIWLVVYSPIWAVVLVIVYFVRRRMRRSVTPIPPVKTS